MQQFFSKRTKQAYSFKSKIYIEYTMCYKSKSSWSVKCVKLRTSNNNKMKMNILNTK